MSESKGPSTEAIALYTNVFGCVPDTEALEAGDVWEIAHIDAALRRAKAEGKLEGMEEAAILVEAMPMATPYNTALSLRWVVKERREADARAAQIEEGEE